MHNILVTGGAGFIGRHLCQALLDEGHNVICVDDFSSSHPNDLGPLRAQTGFQLIEQDICAPLDLPFKIERIFNLASPASPVRYQLDPIQTLKTNVVGTLNLLELARQHGARLLQASTSEVYGDPLTSPQHESYNGNVNPIGPRACYDEGKRCAETLCSDYRRQFQLDTRIVRIFNTYGPGMQIDDGRVITNFVAQALNNQPITVYGDGLQTRSFCYVADLVDGLQRLMALPDHNGEPVNLGNPEPVNMLQLASLIQHLCHSRSPLFHRPLPQDDPLQREPNIERARQLLGWLPSTPLSEGLQRTIAALQSRLEQDNACNNAQSAQPDTVQIL
ncbi:MAG: NAD-dependent dehydratase [Gammaproteobacteria bacterium HGW-Gammaproteobacteria-11]|nr:MAG: NAD-dependent dehydratase [Gammaproteobacteria bacterium HGW-Gammaproteobacteria-11]